MLQPQTMSSSSTPLTAPSSSSSPSDTGHPYFDTYASYCSWCFSSVSLKRCKAESDDIIDVAVDEEDDNTAATVEGFTSDRDEEEDVVDDDASVLSSIMIRIPCATAAARVMMHVLLFRTSLNVKLPSHATQTKP